MRIVALVTAVVVIAVACGLLAFPFRPSRMRREGYASTRLATIPRWADAVMLWPMAMGLAFAAFEVIRHPRYDMELLTVSILAGSAWATACAAIHWLYSLRHPDPIEPPTE